MVIYFSGTGNSRWCAQMLAHRLEDELLDSAGYIRHGIAAELISGKPWVFVAPVYAWQAPAVFQSFIRSGNFDGAEDAYFVLTCGSETGAAGAVLEDLCREKGLRYRGLLPVPMPENYITLFAAPAPARCEAMLEAARPRLAEAAERIAGGEELPPVKTGLLDRLKSGPVNQGFYRYFIKADPFYATDACVSCGLCAERCPLGNIRLEAGKPVWGKTCTQCMACICSCPKEAVEYGRRSRGKRRYLCPDWTP